MVIVAERKKLKKKSESLIVGTQDHALRTNSIKAKIDKIKQISNVEIKREMRYSCGY